MIDNFPDGFVPKHNMSYFDNLYVPDPFSGSILKPPAIWMVDPFTWGHKPDWYYQPDTWTGDKWPFDAQPTTAPYVPKVPWTEKPAPPDYSWQETHRIIEESKKRAEAEKQKEVYEKLFEQIQAATKINLGFNAPKSPWTNTVDGGSKFILELAGRSRESVSVEIKDGKFIIVANKLVGPNCAQIGGTYDIPSPNNLNLEAAQLTMEHGLLTIIFPPKKVIEKKAIKLL